jgi:DNA-binding LytR/AlgR family response regulator
MKTKEYSIQIGNKVNICIQDIVMLEANTNYTYLHLINGTKLMASYHLGKLHKRLSTSGAFVRPNRNNVVNMNFLISYTPDSLNINEKIVKISRRRRIDVFRWLEGSNKHVPR